MYTDFYNSCKNFVEGFFGMRFSTGCVDLDDEIVKPIMGRLSTAISIQYPDLMCYVIWIISNKKISLWIYGKTLC